MLILKQIMLRYLRLLLLPFSFLYGLVIVFRNKAYDWGLLKSTEFDLPTIVIGNLAIGGTGKSPMTEYLIRLLKDKYKIASLSRGYGRKTKGFRIVNENDNPRLVGDEPLQFKRKYPEITVAVCEDRVKGLKKLESEHDLVVLDDAYQHRALKPGFSILLLEYKSIFQPKLLLPAGDFRDTFNQKKRADILIISKSPQDLSFSEKQNVLKVLNASVNQKVLFSYIKYGQPYALDAERSVFGEREQAFDQQSSVLVVTGIANPDSLVKYLEARVKQVYLLKYSDHHTFTKQDIRKIYTKFELINEQNKLIITTEKDAQRLRIDSLSSLLQPLPIVVLPIETAFDDKDEKTLSEEIFSYCHSKNKNIQNKNE